MSITRAQIARQLLAQGGVSLNDAKTMAPKGEFLAYINPKEAQMLKDAGGSGIMTPMGIPSFVDFGGAGSGYGSAQDTFDSAAGRGGSRTGSGGGQGPSRSDTGTGTDDVYQGSSETNQAIAKANRSIGQKIVDSIRGISNFTPFGIARKGLGFLFDKFQNLRGFNPDGTRRTQAQFERARDIRRAEKSISNIMGRNAPFTDLTLDRLEGLYESLYGKGNVPSNINDSLIGTTNTTRSGTSDGITNTNAANDLVAEQLSFPYDFMNTGDPYKDNLYDQDGNYKPSLNTLVADVSPADLMLNNMRGSNLYDLDSFKGFSGNTTLTQEELDGIRDGTIKAPTGMYVG